MNGKIKRVKIISLNYHHSEKIIFAIIRSLSIRDVCTVQENN